MAHEEHGHEKEPIIPTSARRMGKGLLIMVVTLAVGAAIIVPFFNAMYQFPPPVNKIAVKPPTEQPPAEAGTTTIAILHGAASQGSPDYDPDDGKVPLGNKVVWSNQDTVPHTATSGSGSEDPNKAKLFDTSIIMAGKSSSATELKGAKEGDTFNYFCTVHPYMTGKFTVTTAGTGGNTTGTSGPSINILQGAASQGSPDFDPDELKAKKGDEITVANHDTVPHTVTSGTGSSDPNKGKLFDTSIISGGKSAKISLAEVDPGQYDYFCVVHEYMKGKLVVE